jgi:hypothetical protein
MTHKELLTKIDAELATDYEDAGGNFPVGLNALRAVVELHKPILRGFSTFCDLGCNDEGGYLEPYPCKTIQAIEKELK